MFVRERLASKQAVSWPVLTSAMNIAAEMLRVKSTLCVVCQKIWTDTFHIIINTLTTTASTSESAGKWRNLASLLRYLNTFIYLFRPSVARRRRVIAYVLLLFFSFVFSDPPIRHEFSESTGPIFTRKSARMSVSVPWNSSFMTQATIGPYSSRRNCRHVKHVVS